MFQVLDPIPKKGSLCRQRDRKIPRESWKRWWLAGKREQMGRRRKQRKGDQCDFRLAFGCQKRSDCLWRHSMKKMKQIVLSNTLDTSTQIRYAHISSLFVVKSISYRTPYTHAILVLFTIFYLFVERYGGNNTYCVRPMGYAHVVTYYIVQSIISEVCFQGLY